MNRYWKIPICYDDDNDEESSILLKDIISELPPCVAITPDSPKTNSLIMEDEHLDTIPETKSDELIKSSGGGVPKETLSKSLSESEDSSEGECDCLPYDDSSKNHDLTFYNPLFDIIEDFTSSDESFSEEDVDQIDDEVLENTNSIPPGIDDVNLDSKGDILFLERDSTIDVVEDIPLYVPIFLAATISPFNWISNFIESTRNLATLPPVIDTLLTFSSENEDKVFNHGVLASKEKSPSSPSHRGFKASKVFHQKSPMLIHGDNTPDLGVRHPHFYPP
ncbi:hypothetical protein Tco_0982075 [Tanacetum coccineum]